MRREEGQTLLASRISHVSKLCSNPHCFLVGQQILRTVAQQRTFITLRCRGGLVRYMQHSAVAVYTFAGRPKIQVRTR